MAEITQKQEYKCKGCGIRISGKDFCFDCWDYDYQMGGLKITIVIGILIAILWLVL